ncbi:MAG: DMT family transporter, partial [Anaerolineae bacterium]
MKKSSPHVTAVLQALLVTFLWSTSWVLIKIGLADMPPVTFAGMRFFLAFLVLLPFYRRSEQATPLRALSVADWRDLLGLGLLYYAITQGSMFVALVYLDAIPFSVLLNSTAVVVAVLGILLLAERPSWLQWGGVVVFVVGALVFFLPFIIPAGQGIGFAIATGHVLATSLSAIWGRGINRQARIHPLTVTTISMGAGSTILLLAGLLTEPFPRLTLTSVGIILWLAVVNTAFAFTLWNHTMRTLSAMESSIINNTMLIQVTILA